MPNIEKAVHLLQPGDRAIIIKTNGDKFLTNDTTGLGSTGNWVVSAERTPNRVIVYEIGRDSVIRIHTADFRGKEPSGEGKRYVVLMSSIKLAGTTDKNWYEFAETSRNPVRYLEG